MPEPVVYLPVVQLVQTEKGVNEYCPAVHREQTERPVLPVKLPAAQLAQVPIPEPVVYWPAGQLVQAENGSAEYCPAVHREQTERPALPV
jgi:hypothetical protein